MTKAQVACMDVWKKCLDIIRDNIPSQSYKTWFEPIIPLRLDHNVLTIQVPSQFFYEWIEENYVNLLRSTLRHFLGPEAKLEYSIIIENGKDGNNNYAVNIPTALSEKDKKNPPVNYPLNADKPIPTHWVMPGLKKINIDPGLNSLYTFDTFVAGDCNLMARNAGIDLSERVDNYTFRTLFIHGGFGQGKTHLSQAIGNEIKKRYPNKVILYIQCEKFINQFTDSIKSGSSTEFVNFYQLIDVLIIDDIHFLANKTKTMETFFHVFNHLHQAQKVMVFTSDTAANDLKGVDERLINRFKWGCNVELQSPDLQTRINILKRKMYSEGIRISDTVTEYIAEHITSNVRELEGAMISLIAQSSLNKKEIDIDLAASIVKNFVKNANREISIDYIQKVVSEYFEIQVEKLKEKTRKREVVQARQISMFFAKKYTNLSLKAIGQHFGGRDHSTVIHAITTVNDLMIYDKLLKQQVEDIQKKIQTGKN